MCHSLLAAGSSPITPFFGVLSLVLVMAVVVALLLTKARQSVLVGYFLVGVLIANSGLLELVGAKADDPAILMLAELGVILLMFTLGIEFSTASAWGVPYECRKLAEAHDVVIIDTPPKADSDLRPALRAADLVLIPVASSHLDLWAVEVVLYLTDREEKPAMMVMTRSRSGTRLGADVAKKAAEMDAEVARTPLANRVVYAETLGQGKAALEAPKGPAHTEVMELVWEVEARLDQL